MEEKVKVTKRNVTVNFIWKFAEAICTQGVTFIVSMVLARLLNPEDYGIVSIINVFIAIANVVITSGFQSALIQSKNADEVDFSSVLYLNLGTAAIIYSILFGCAPFIEKFYSISDLASVVRVLGIQIILYAFNSVQRAYVSKCMQFKKFFFSTLIGTVISGALGIILAYNGYGVWALVIQIMSNTVFDSLVLLVTFKWRPKLIFSINKVKRLFSYGWKMLVSGIVCSTYEQLSNLIIGKCYSASSLAFYNRGQSYPSLLVSTINSSLGSVLFPAISNVQDEIAQVKNMTRRSIQLSSFFIWPMMIGMMVVAKSFVIVFFTAKWIECVPYIQIFCLVYALYPIHTANLSAIQAIGRSDLFLKLEIYKIIVGFIIMLITVNISAKAMAIGMVITGILSSIINTAPNKKILSYSYIEQIKDQMRAIIAAVLMGVIITNWKYVILNNIVLLIIQIITGALSYFLISLVINRKIVGYFLQIIKNKEKV